MKKRWKLIAAILVAVLVIGWVVLPEPLKQIAVFQVWRGSHLRVSGSVDREPAGTRIVWQEFGDPAAPPVVVLHCGFCAITMMGAQIRALAPGHRVIAIASRGHDLSTNTGDRLTYEMMSDDVVAVMDAAKIARADIVGWSDGGTIALDVARRHPDRVGKVVACGAVYNTQGTVGQELDEIRNATPDSSAFAPMKFFYERSNPDPARWSVFFQQVKAMILNEPNWTQDQLATIRARVLLVNGEHDMVPLSHANEIKNAIPGARLEIIPGAPHEAPMSNPGEVNALALAFLAAQ